MTIETRYVTYAAGDPETHVGVEPDLWFEKYAHIEVTDDPRLPLDVTLRVVFDRAAAQYMVDSMTLRRKKASGAYPGPTVLNSVALREVPVLELLRNLGPSVHIGSPTGMKMADTLSADEAEAIKAAGPSNGETLLWVSRIYTVAHALNQPPGKAVQEQLRLTGPTASVWIRRARDRGLLHETFDEPQWWMTDEEFDRARSVLED